jgi:LysM repeat protein
MEKLMVAAAFLMLVTGLFINLGVKVTAANDHSSGSQPAWHEIVVQNGDTLWCLAEKYVPDKDTRKVIHEIREINSLESADLMPGQVLRIPQ